MRGFVATISLIIAIGGLLVIIGYGAASAYLDLREEEADLYDSLLMASSAPADWTAVEASGIALREQFVTPCLQTPLLEGVGIKGRGAAEYGPSTAGTAGIQALVLQTSESNARSIMEDIDRDTENDCQRGVTVGTVESATSRTIDFSPVEQAILVNYERLISDSLVEQSAIFFQDGEYVGRLTYDRPQTGEIPESELMSLAASLASRAADPPTSAELEAAGVVDEPSPVEAVAERTKAETSNLLSASGRFPIEVGLGSLGVAILLLYVFGARMSRGTGAVVRSSTSPVQRDNPTLSNYGTTERETYKSYVPSTPIGSERSSEDAEPIADDRESNRHDDEESPETPPAILNFPQRPIEEKLKILKEARLREPKREHRAVREISPEVDWTEEISKEQPKKASVSSDPRSTQVSRKVLLKKLRSNQTESQ